MARWAGRGLFLGAILALGGCAEDPGEVRVLADCVGAYTGDYDGVEEGIVDATLGDDGVLGVTFTSVDDAVTAEANVGDDGEVTGQEGPIGVSGVFDFDVCAATGSWSAYGLPVGAWSVAQSTP